VLHLKERNHLSDIFDLSTVRTEEIRILTRVNAAVAENSAITPAAKRICINRILAPTDLSSASIAGIRYAIDAARKFQAELVVYHVVSGKELAVFARGRKTKRLGAAPSRGIIETFASRLRDFIRRSIGADALSVRIKQRVEIGHPKKSIIEAARSEAADLIIFTKSGRGWFAKIFFGSVTEEVMRKAPCPVLTVPVSWTPVREERGVFATKTQSVSI
jgi:nucleotide-binding universal stress UspA family protein